VQARQFFYSNNQAPEEISPMRRSWYSLAVFALVLAMAASSCKGKKVEPKAPVQQQQAAPAEPEKPALPATLSFNVDPAAIERGQSTTLSWNSSNAVNVTIEPGIGTVEASGSRTVSPRESTSYTARARGADGKTVVIEKRVTVTAPQAAVERTPETPIEKWFSDKIKDAFFDYDQYNIRPDAQSSLQADANALKERPNVKIRIEGYCDERGSEKYNLALGDMRANAAKEYLVSQGIEPGRIETVSYGKESQTFCEEQNEGCWSQQRRAHIVMR
jgi:peptidoglycan-associated lipoprotein